MVLFFVGIIEMAISAAWTRMVSDNRTLPTGVITMMNIFIWYYVLNQVVNNINGWHVIVPYALGCACGAMLGTVKMSRARKVFNKLCAKLRLKKTAYGQR